MSVKKDRLWALRTWCSHFCCLQHCAVTFCQEPDTLKDKKVFWAPNCHGIEECKSHEESSDIASNTDRHVHSIVQQTFEPET